jgi:septum site-determining protein MinD
VKGLFDKGLIDITRLNNAQRAVLLSATRTLQTSSEIAQLEREQGALQRNLEKLEDQSRIDLLAELQIETAEITQMQAEMDALTKQIFYVGLVPSDLLTQPGRQLAISVTRFSDGKTTTTANLGAAMASRGRSVVLIDADIGLRNLDIVLGLENRIVYDLVDVVEGNCRLRQALIRDKRLNAMHLIPAAQTREKDAVSQQQMKTLCDELRRQFDYVLIDSPAGIEQGFKNSIAGADEVVVVTNPEVSSVRDADRIIGLIEAAELPTPRLIVNRLDPIMVQRGEMMTVEDVAALEAWERLPSHLRILDGVLLAKHVAKHDLHTVQDLRQRHGGPPSGERRSLAGEDPRAAATRRRRPAVRRTHRASPHGRARSC